MDRHIIHAFYIKIYALVHILSRVINSSYIHVHK